LDAKEEFEATIWYPWVLARTKRQVVEECQAKEILSGGVNTIDEVMDDNPQFDARDYWVEIDHPKAGKFRYPGAPMKTEEKWWRINTHLEC
jgi:CoA:oxalate CoA-transferase